MGNGRAIEGTVGKTGFMQMKLRSGHFREN